MAEEFQSQLEIYYGSSRRGIEASYRILVPKEWRPKEGPMEFMIIPWPLDKEPHDYLLVVPKTRYLASTEAMRKLSLTNEKAGAFKRTIGSSAKEAKFDGYGRLALSESLLKSAEIGTEAELVGCVDHFELWSPAKYEGAKPNHRKTAAEVQHEFFV